MDAAVTGQDMKLLGYVDVLMDELNKSNFA
jgi:hypothetical protein